MNQDYLFRGLLAALRVNGVQFIETRNDMHHDSFRYVVDELEQRQEEFPNIPSTFVPSPFTGRFREFDDALLRLQHGLLGAQNPFYTGMNLSVSEDRAQKILDEYPGDERKFLSHLAHLFVRHAETRKPV